MRAPVFSKGSNPSVHAPILRKNVKYCEDQVALGNACWVNPTNLREGIVCLGKLVFGATDFMEVSAGSRFDTAWHIRQSGPDGPLVWQLRSKRALV